MVGQVLKKSFLLIAVVLLFGTGVAAAEDVKSLEAAHEEIAELKQMVNMLASEVRELKAARGRDQARDSQYQNQLQEIRDDVTNINQTASNAFQESMSKLTLAGYGEIHANFEQDSHSDEIDFHRLVLYLGYDFADWIKFHSETELEHAFINDNDTADGGSASGGEVSLEQAYVDFLLSDNFNVRAGRFLAPIGIINPRHEPTLFNGVERPNFSKFIIPTTWSTDGIGFFGSLNPSLNYQAYVVAGLDGDKFSSSGIRGGRMKSRQSLNEVAFTGRLDYRPFQEALGQADQSLRLGLSGFYGGLDNVDGGGKNGKGGQIAMTSADFEYSVSKFDFRGVIANTNIDGARNLGSSNVAKEMFGWYLEGAYRFMPDSWKVGKLKDADAAVFVRYEEYDTQHKMPSGIAKDKTKDIDEVTFGVNFYLTPSFVIKADYQIRHDQAGSNKNDLFNMGIGWTF